MNILLISQCDKRALTETRRILDQFAERRGDRTWQTPITEAGLDTLRRLLRKTARKNTAVACHWIRGRDHSELLWIVGDARRFNGEGAVPTNTTERNVLRRQDENDWHSAEDIRLLAQLAALLHDLGKASVAFQQRLAGKLSERNRYRHEWVSLRLFQAFVGDDDDASWLARLAEPARHHESDWTAPGRYQRDGLDSAIDRHPLRRLAERAPLAAAIGWLVVTHHRLPVAPAMKDDGTQDWLGKRSPGFNPAWLEMPLAQVAHDWNEIHQPATRDQLAAYWDLAGALPVVEPSWRAQAARLAKRLQARHSHRKPDVRWLDNTYVMHLARLSLMLADHYYSSLPKDSSARVRGDGTTRLFANTDSDGRPKQPLDEHLLGVARDAGLISHALPGFERHLPRLANHRGLRKRSADSRFSWQDKAFDAASAMREDAAQYGAFIINMASTGCGKTLANARILYALADPQLGLRASYALGLRTLTLQTGRSYRQDLHLGDDELAVLVGGSASRALFEFYQQKAEKLGSASIQNLLEEDSHVLYEGVMADHPLLSRALADTSIRQLLSAPVLVCTVDHLVPATEALRAGRQIAPMLRLMSSDLILDELDDYDLNDLPALTRLVHWAGMLGSRVVLSSATLPPALVEGMFMAYQAGRRLYQINRGAIDDQAAGDITLPCLWTDEFGSQLQRCSELSQFATQHRQFVERRVDKLRQMPVLRQAELLPLTITTRQRERIRAEWAAHLRQASLRLHHAHASGDPISGKQVSFGLIRMANIDPIVDVARQLHALGGDEQSCIHLCVYHARFPLAQRSAIEHLLDSAFNRRDPSVVWQLPSVRQALDHHPQPNQLFVVLASPVCEVGRDWDADWAIAEPSSMRSLIQLAGRVQRHRRIPPASANVLVMQTNLKHLEQADGNQPAFLRPGFEKAGDERFLLASHDMHLLLRDDELGRLDATPRIQPQTEAAQQPHRYLADLEQARMRASMLPAPPRSASSHPRRSASSVAPTLERDQASAVWQHPQAMLSGVLPQQQPFRDDSQRQTTLVFLPDEDDETLLAHRVESDPTRRGNNIYVLAEELLQRLTLHPSPGIAPWGEFELLPLVETQAQSTEVALDVAARKYTTLSLPHSEQGWRWHPWLGFTPKR